MSVFYKINFRLLQYYRSFKATVHIFTNWYEIIKHLSIKSDAKVLECIFKVDPTISVTLDKSIIFFLIGLENEGLLSTIDLSENLCINNSLEIIPSKPIQYSFLIADGWQKNLNNGSIEKNDLKFIDEEDPGPIFDTFVTKDYDFEVKDREVLDIGGNIGDTAIYFSRTGASWVYSYEASPRATNIAIQNLKLNNVENVSVNNYIVSNSLTKGYFSLSIDNEQSGSFSIKRKYGGAKVEVASINLSSIIQKMSDLYLLKMDCEGCEYDLILNSYEDLRKFEFLIFECHSLLMGKSWKALLKKLKADYDITVKRIGLGQSLSNVSMFYCRKRNSSDTRCKVTIVNSIEDNWLMQQLRLQ